MSEATQPAGTPGVSVCLGAPAPPLADGPLLLPPDSQLPLTRQDGAWGAAAGPLAGTCSLAPHSALTQPLFSGQHPLSPAAGRRLSPGQSLRLVGRRPVVGPLPPG